MSQWGHGGGHRHRECPWGISWRVERDGRPGGDSDLAAHEAPRLVAGFWTEPKAGR